MTTAHTTCPSTTRAGRPCAMQPLSDDPDGYCPAHSPAYAAAREEARRKGGRNRRKAPAAPEAAPTAVPGDIAEPLVMRTHEQIRAAMETITNAMRTGALSSRTGAAMVQAARVAMSAVNEDRDRRIEELERAVAAQQPATTNRRRR